jgi:hypothetical protein
LITTVRSRAHLPVRAQPLDRLCIPTGTESLWVPQTQ